MSWRDFKNVRNFNKLEIPEYWEQYWSKYPNGYTIMEAIINWASQVDKMVDDINNIHGWIDELLDYLKYFFDELDFTEEVENKVKVMLNEWRDNGTLETIINHELFGTLNDRMDDFDEHHRFYGSTIDRKKKPKPMIAWVDDDGHEGFLTKLTPLGEEYGVPFTCGMITSRFGEERSTGTVYMTKEMVRECIDRGMEVMSHGHESHNASRHPKDWGRNELRKDLEKSKQIIKDLGGNYRGHVEPFGSYTSTTIDVAREVFDYNVGTGTRGDRINTADNFSNYEIKRTQGQGRDFEEIKPVIDEAIEKNALLVFVSHVDQNGGIDLDVVEQIIQYAQANNVEWVTIEQAMREHGNILEYKQAVWDSDPYHVEHIASNGEIHANNLGRVIIDHNPNIGGNTPLDYFTPYAITHSMIRGGQVGGFPNYNPIRSGMLKTYRLHGNEKLWNYQIFISTRKKLEFIRYWDTVEEGWTDWVGRDVVQYLEPNSINISDKPTDDKFFRKITFSTVNSNHENQASFPEGKSGYLEFRALTNDSFSFQKYTIYHENKEYIRWWSNGSKTWGEWRPASNVILDKVEGGSFNKQPTDYYVGITYEIFRTGETPSEFGGEAGTLKTVIPADLERFGRFGWQEFHYNKQAGYFKRAIKKDLTWNNWWEIKTD